MVLFFIKDFYITYLNALKVLIIKRQQNTVIVILWNARCAEFLKMKQIKKQDIQLNSYYTFIKCFSKERVSHFL